MDFIRVLKWRPFGNEMSYRMFETMKLNEKLCNKNLFEYLSLLLNIHESM